MPRPLFPHLGRRFRRRRFQCLTQRDAHDSAQCGSEREALVRPHGTPTSVPSSRPTPCRPHFFSQRHSDGDTQFDSDVCTIVFAHSGSVSDADEQCAYACAERGSDRGAGDVFPHCGRGTNAPTLVPTSRPTFSPTAVPSASPSVTPTTVPSAVPSVRPTFVPTATPTSVPSSRPTALPTTSPSVTPTATPSLIPTCVPSCLPTAVPSQMPTSSVPTHVPSGAPTEAPVTSSPLWTGNECPDPCSHISADVFADGGSQCLTQRDAHDSTQCGSEREAHIRPHGDSHERAIIATHGPADHFSQRHSDGDTQFDSDVCTIVFAHSGSVSDADEQCAYACAERAPTEAPVTSSPLWTGKRMPRPLFPHLGRRFRRRRFPVPHPARRPRQYPVRFRA